MDGGRTGAGGQTKKRLTLAILTGEPVPMEVAEAWGVFALIRGGFMHPPTYEEMQTWPAWMVKDLRFVSSVYSEVQSSKSDASPK